MATIAPGPSLTKGARTRLRLLEAAEKVFGQNGYHAASIGDITREANVAMGTFYVYFPSKKEILTELVQVRGHELRSELHEATRGLARRADIERAGFESFFGWVRRHPDLYRVVRNAEFVEREVFRDWYRKLGEAYVRGLKAAMDAGEIARADPEALAYCLMAAGDFIGMRYVLWEEGGKVPPRVLETVMGFVLRGLGAEGAAGGNGAQRRR